MSAPHFAHFSGFAIILSVVDTAPGNDGTAAAGLAAPTAEQHRLLAAYLAELERWNRRHNLTAVPAGAAWARHVDESLRLLDALDIAAGGSVIDVGSGAGVPGVVIAVVRPDARVALLEADARKCGFLTHVAGHLGLRSLTVFNRRAEDAARDPELRDRFDAAVSRAAAPPPVLCELALPFVRPGGVLGALVTDPEAAARACERAALLCGGGSPAPAGAGVLTIPKSSVTPATYPRRSGVPARRPLG